MKYSPHEYQTFATDYILEHPVSAIFLECGLGKSVITLTAIFDLTLDSFLIRKVLVIAPLRVAADTWPAEIEKWDHLRGLKYAVAVGSERQRKSALLQRAQVYIINRENVEWLVCRSGLPFDYDMVVVDELSSFKSHQAKRFKSLLKARPSVKRIVGLTGTPSSNGLMDLWAEFRLLDMGQRLGRFIGKYRAEYFAPDKRNGQVVFSYKPLPGAEKKIYEQISDITVSMKNADHLKLPELVTNEVPVWLSEKERNRYEEFKRNMAIDLKDGEVTAANAAALSGKLLQMANGAVYGDDGAVRRIHERKLDALEDLIEAANGKPVLVAYWFRHDLERITERLKRLHIPFSKLDDAASIRRWNNGELPVALIHPASAGHGLNLQAGGSCLVWFSLTWSLELYQQTNARLWRQGQKDTVVVHHIVARGTIDEQVMKALKNKDKTQAALIEAVKANLRKPMETKNANPRERNFYGGV
jgi:SNF2 family DNA or RNA helicase